MLKNKNNWRFKLSGSLWNFSLSHLKYVDVLKHWINLKTMLICFIHQWLLTKHLVKLTFLPSKVYKKFWKYTIRDDIQYILCLDYLHSIVIINVKNFNLEENHRIAIQICFEYILQTNVEPLHCLFLDLLESAAKFCSTHTLS